MNLWTLNMHERDGFPVIQGDLEKHPIITALAFQIYVNKRCSNFDLGGVGF